MFYVVTNNYRASGGGNFPGVNAQAIVHEDQFETREVLADYLKELAANNPGGFAPPVDNNWRLADLPSNLDLRFYTSPLEEAKAVVGQRARYLSTQPTSESRYPGFGVYQLVLAP
jgi:2',3'-cyclic-nucleotide 2'-phosphodiesterase/3'-nucleotidase